MFKEKNYIDIYIYTNISLYTTIYTLYYNELHLIVNKQMFVSH